MKDLERQLKALANRRRLAILKYLKGKREAAVSEIAGIIKLSIKATSKHLNILASVNIVESEQRSLRVFYRLSQDQKSAAKHIVSIL